MGANYASCGVVGRSAADPSASRVGANLSQSRKSTGYERPVGKLRALVKQADPDVVEERKWRGTPVGSHDGIVCMGETHKRVVKMTFAKEASLKTPSGQFNSSPGR